MRSSDGDIARGCPVYDGAGAWPYPGGDEGGLFGGCGRGGLEAGAGWYVDDVSWPAGVVGPGAGGGDGGPLGWVCGWGGGSSGVVDDISVALFLRSDSSWMPPGSPAYGPESTLIGREFRWTSSTALVTRPAPVTLLTAKRLDGHRRRGMPPRSPHEEATSTSASVASGPLRGAMSQPLARRYDCAASRRNDADRVRLAPCCEQSELPGQFPCSSGLRHQQSSRRRAVFRLQGVQM
jgi:hypothetical protein